MSRIELRAALAAGATPAVALAAAASQDPRFLPVARAAGLGIPLEDICDQAPADLQPTLRALCLAERIGAPSLGLLDGIEVAERHDGEVAALIAARTAQASGTVKVLSVLPLALVAFLAVLDADVVAFYTTTGGRVVAGIALGMWWAGRLWSRRIVSAAERAGWEADAIGGDGRGKAETIALLAAALRGGASPSQAVAAAVAIAPAAARQALRTAGRRLSLGEDPAAAFAGSLAEVGTALGAADRWGAPAAPLLERQAVDIRMERRRQADLAAERCQLRLVFPTTLLTLPAFVLLVVPSLLWAAFTD